MIVYGDSYTSGENNHNISFADYLGIKKRGVSGSCFDEYSIYPVANGSFVSTYQDTNEIVFLEYGINDAASLAVGYIGIDTVKVALAKTVDLLKGKKPVFLSLSNDEKVLAKFSKRYADYLNKEYLKGLYDISPRAFYAAYQRICWYVQGFSETVYMLPSGFKSFDVDGIHPNDKGYKDIADNIKKQFVLL